MCSRFRQTFQHTTLQQALEVAPRGCRFVRETAGEPARRSPRAVRSDRAEPGEQRPREKARCSSCVDRASPVARGQRPREHCGQRPREPRGPYAPTAKPREQRPRAMCPVERAARHRTDAKGDPLSAARKMHIGPRLPQIFGELFSILTSARPSRLFASLTNEPGRSYSHIPGGVGCGGAEARRSRNHDRS